MNGYREVEGEAEAFEAACEAMSVSYPLVFEGVNGCFSDELEVA